MKKYLEEISHAASSLIDLIWFDFDKLEERNSQLKALTAEFDVKHQVFLANEFHPAANFYHAQMAKAHEGIAKPKAELEREIMDVLVSSDENQPRFQHYLEPFYRLQSNVFHSNTESRRVHLLVKTLMEF
jgi:hypothetical protein